jgi:preprotein translocase subunit YajC
MFSANVWTAVWTTALGQDQGAKPIEVTGTPQGASQPFVAPSSTQAAPSGTTNNASGGGLLGGPMIFLPLILVFGFMIWSQYRNEKKERQRRQEMTQSLRRGEKVQMIGGILGTVSDISDDEVVVQVEQGKIRFSKSSIQQVLRTDAKASGEKSHGVVESKPGSTTASV